MEESLGSCPTHHVETADFDVNRYLAEVASVLPQGAAFVGSNPSNAFIKPADEFPLHWRELCRLTLPPNGFSSQPWWNNKAERKSKWLERGLSERYLVPTLYDTYFSTKREYNDADRHFDYDEASGEMVLAWDEAKTRHTPADASCREAMAQVLQRESRFVLKPMEGNRAEGVMLVSATADPSRLTIGQVMEAEVAVRKHTSEARLADRGGGDRMSFAAWFQECVLANAHIKTGVLVEPMVEWDNEVTSISLAGGAMVVVGSKGGGLVRSSFAIAATRGSHAPVDPIVLVEGRPPLRVLQGTVLDARREQYQLRSGSTGEAPSAMLTRLRDASGRRLTEVMADVVRAVTAGVSITRVDFFVKYRPEREGACAVLLNEVEHGFDAGLLPSWFGMQMTELISKAYILLGASAEDRAAYVAQHRQP